MIPLAQAWLSNEHRSKTRYDAELQRHLELPTVYNKYTTASHINELAERIVFTNDVPSLLYEMEDNRQLTYSGILSTVRLPYDCFWLEYKGHSDELYDEGASSKSIHFGALVRKIDSSRVRMLVVCGLPSVRFKGELVAGIVYVIEFPKWPPMYVLENNKKAFGFNVLYAFNKDRIISDGGEIEHNAAINISWVLTEIIFGIFLITQPKTYSDDIHRASSKLQRARAKSGKSPLLEYRRINVHIGRKYSHYKRPTTALQQSLHQSTDTDSNAAVTHRRYHKVMGHFRHYVNSDNPHTTWIEPHYRGDPSLGVTFTERDVMR